MQAKVKRHSEQKNMQPCKTHSTAMTNDTQASSINTDGSSRNSGTLGVLWNRLTNSKLLEAIGRDINCTVSIWSQGRWTGHVLLSLESTFNLQDFRGVATEPRDLLTFTRI